MIFVVQHNPYPVKKFELGRPSEQRKWLGNIFVMNNIMNNYEKKNNENSRPLNLVCISCTLYAYTVVINV